MTEVTENNLNDVHETGPDDPPFPPPRYGPCKVNVTSHFETQEKTLNNVVHELG